MVSAYVLFFANFALPLQAVTLQSVEDEALFKRAGHGTTAGEAHSRNGMVDLQFLIEQHAASEAELHARAAETFRNFASKVAKNGCNYRGGLLPCPTGHICYYTGQAGVNVSATVEYRGNIIRTVLHPDPEAGFDQPDLVTFMGAGTNDNPAMLTEVPAEYRRTENPVMLKMFFVEDTDNVTEECPHDSERIESMGNETVSYSVNNSTFAVSTQSRASNTFLGMAFDFVNETALGHTLAFEIPSGTEIVWVSREEMVQVLLTQELPASTESRLEAQLRRKAYSSETELDEAVSAKGSRRRRRRRAPKCTSSQVGAMVGGAAAVGLAFLICAFTFIGCFTVSGFLMMVGPSMILAGACGCWAHDTTGQAACEFGNR